MDVTAPELALVFFNEWYCKNGLPLKLVSDRDKLLVSKFWKALHKLTGVHLKMSSAYHPQTDGASKQTNKTLNQCIHFHVKRNQKGWICALPIIRFNMMNSINASTGYSGFQLWMGCSPQIIPPLVQIAPHEWEVEMITAGDIIAQMDNNVADAKDTLLGTKILQAFYLNKLRGPEDTYALGDKVMLATLNC